MPARRAPGIVTVLAAILDSLDRLDRRLDTLGDHVKAARKGIDRLALPEGHDAHPEFAEAAPLWLLERYQDGRPRGVYFPSNCATAAGALVPTRRLGDAMRFTTLADAERFIASDRRFASFRAVPDPLPRVAVVEVSEEIGDLFCERGDG